MYTSNPLQVIEKNFKKKGKKELGEIERGWEQKKKEEWKKGEWTMNEISDEENSNVENNYESLYCISYLASKLSLLITAIQYVMEPVLSIIVQLAGEWVRVRVQCVFYLLRKSSV